MVGFFSHSKLKKVDPSGGQPEVICDAGADPGGATWNREGVIVFAPNFEGVLYRVPASGGQPIAITEAYKTYDETNHLCYYLLLLLLSVDLAPWGTRSNTGDSFKSKTDVDNKRHTNAHQPLTSHSPIGVSSPLSVIAKISSKICGYW